MAHAVVRLVGHVVCWKSEVSMRPQHVWAKAQKFAELAHAAALSGISPQGRRPTIWNAMQCCAQAVKPPDTPSLRPRACIFSVTQGPVLTEA